jgi:peroxiredoxin
MRRLLVPTLALGVAAALVVGAAYLVSEPAAALNPGDAAPDLVLKDLRGAPGGGIPLLGQAPVLLLFFDSRWPASVEWLKYTEGLHRRFVAGGLAVIGVCWDDDAAAAQRSLLESQARFIVQHDPGGAVSRPAYGALTAPRAWLIDARGRVVKVVRDPNVLRESQTRLIVAGLLPLPSPIPHR